MAATHYAYQGAKGSPVLARNVWHDRADVFLVVDFASGSATHTYTQSFNLFTNNTTKFTGGTIHTASGSGDVLLQPLLLDGQTTSSGSVTLSNTPPPDGSVKGLRFAITQQGRTALFATLVVTYDNGVVPDVSAHWIKTPTLSRSGQIEVIKNGVSTIVYFPYPNLAPVSGAAAKRSLPAAAQAVPVPVPSLAATLTAFAHRVQVNHDSTDDLFGQAAD
jgi:hypothetical protein